MHQPSSVNRRDFLQTVAAADAIGSIPTLLPASAAAEKAAQSARPEVVAIYCPLWHRYDHMDS